MPCSVKFSMTLQTEILSIETSDFLKQIIFLKSFTLVLSVTSLDNNSAECCDPAVCKLSQTADPET